MGFQVEQVAYPLYLYFCFVARLDFSLIGTLECVVCAEC